jgi:amino acid transporter
MTTGELVVDFFEAYLAAPIIVVSYVGYKVWFRTKFVKISQIDLKTWTRDNQDDFVALKEMDGVEHAEYPW